MYALDFIKPTDSHVISVVNYDKCTVLVFHIPMGVFTACPVSTQHIALTYTSTPKSAGVKVKCAFRFFSLGQYSSSVPPESLCKSTTVSQILVKVS